MEPLQGSDELALMLVMHDVLGFHQRSAHLPQQPRSRAAGHRPGSAP